MDDLDYMKEQVKLSNLDIAHLEKAHEAIGIPFSVDSSITRTYIRTKIWREIYNDRLKKIKNRQMNVTEKMNRFWNEGEAEELYRESRKIYDDGLRQAERMSKIWMDECNSYEEHLNKQAEILTKEAEKLSRNNTRDKVTFHDIWVELKKLINSYSLKFRHYSYINSLKRIEKVINELRTWNVEISEESIEKIQQCYLEHSSFQNDYISLTYIPIIGLLNVNIKNTKSGMDFLILTGCKRPEKDLGGD